MRVVVLVLLALLGLAGPASAARPGPPGLIAFVGEDKRVHVLDEAGAVRPLTPPLAATPAGDVGFNAMTSGDWGPAWSRDGSTVFFDSDRSLPGPFGRLHAIRADGSGLRRIGDHGPWVDFFPGELADGRLVFTRFRYGAGSQLHTSAADGSGAAVLAAAPPGVLGDVSADGRAIALHGSDGRLFLLDDEGPRELLAAGDWMRSASFSPDGRRLALERGSSIVIVPVEGPAVPRRLPAPPGAGEPEWSPDGEWLVLSVPTAAGGSALWAVRPDGTGLQRLTPPEVTAARMPAWQPLPAGAPG